MKSIQRPRDWWAYHYRVVHRNQIPDIAQWDDDLVEMIVDVLDLQPGDRVLELACGSGEHSRRLGRHGMDVLGLDIAPSLVTYCCTKAAEEGLTTVSEFMFIDADGVLNTAAGQERIRVYSLPEWRVMFAEVDLVMTHSLAETKLPLLPYDRDHYGNLVIVGHKVSEA